MLKIVKKLFKIKNNAKFLNKKGSGHYDISPYSYIPKKDKNFSLNLKNIILGIKELKMKSFKKDNFKLLDCTLRDGGYYNNWNFSEKIIKILKIY